MTKILIFTASTGGGHNEAATNLGKGFIRHGYNVSTIDALHILNKSIESLVKSSVNLITGNLSKVYEKLYNFSNHKKSNTLLTESMAKLFDDELNDIIDKEKPDLIISTHPLLVHIIGYLKSSGLINVPYMAIVTDFDAHMTYIDKNVDAYITGSEYTGYTLMEKGILSRKIYPFGIPIKEEFSEANYIKNNKNGFQILLMGGSLGLKAMIKVLSNIVNLKGVFNIVVVCGTNKKLKESLEEDFTDEIHQGLITLYGFTNEIPSIMENSDLLITKPGGLTTSEAIASGLPMLIPYYIAGQEEGNLNYLLSEEIAIYVDDISTINKTIESLMNNPTDLQKMRYKMLNMHNKDYLNDIISLSNRLIGEHQSSI